MSRLAQAGKFLMIDIVLVEDRNGASFKGGTMDMPRAPQAFWLVRFYLLIHNSGVENCAKEMCFSFRLRSVKVTGGVNHKPADSPFVYPEVLEISLQDATSNVCAASTVDHPKSVSCVLRGQLIAIVEPFGQSCRGFALFARVPRFLQLSQTRTRKNAYWRQRHKPIPLAACRAYRHHSAWRAGRPC